MNIFGNFQWYLRKVQRIYRWDNHQYSEHFPLHFVLTFESFHLVYIIPPRTVNSQDKHGEQLNFNYFACKNTRNDSIRSAALWLGRKTKRFSSTNQKPERPRPFGTGLLFAPFFPARLDFPSPPLSAPGSLRMQNIYCRSFNIIWRHVNHIGVKTMKRRAAMLMYQKKILRGLKSFLM